MSLKTCSRETPSWRTVNNLGTKVFLHLGNKPKMLSYQQPIHYDPSQIPSQSQ